MTRPMADRLRAAADEIEAIGDGLLEDPFARGMVRLLTDRGYTDGQLVAELRGIAAAVDRFGVDA